MAGHSKFKNIMHRKNAQDLKKAKVFSNHLKSIALAAKEGVDVDTNFKLRNAIALAKADNVPKENIEKILTKSMDVNDLEAIRYAGYVAGNVALIIETITNNHNRTIKAIRNVLHCNSGCIAEMGAVSFLFEYCSILYYSKEVAKFDDFIDAALGCNIQDCYETEENYQIISYIDQFNSIRVFLESQFSYKLLNYQLIWVPKLEVKVSPEDYLQACTTISELKGLGDVQNVFSNLKLE